MKTWVTFVIALIRLQIVMSSEDPCGLCSQDFHRMVGVLSGSHQYGQDHMYQEEIFDFPLFCSFVEKRNGLGSSVMCRDGDPEILSIFEFLLNQSGCDYSHDIITKGECDTIEIDHAMYSDEKSLICEVCDRLRSLETTSPISASDIQKSSAKTIVQSPNQLIQSESTSRGLTSVSHLELSYSIAYNPMCERIVDEIIESYCECDLYPDSTLNGTTYEAINHELIQFDECLFNTPTDSLCAMVISNFIITSPDYPESEDWSLKYKLNKLINNDDFIHSLHTCSIKTC